MPALQAIYPVGAFQSEPDVLPRKTRIKRTPKPPSAGNDAGLHSQKVRETSRVGGTGSPYAFHKAGKYFFWRFACEVDAREWGCYMGFEFDGEMTERGLEVAMVV